MTGSNVLRLAAWSGLAMGVGEALLSLALQRLGWPIRLSPEILWIAPLYDGALFLAVGVPLMGLARLDSTRGHRLVPTAFVLLLAFGLLQVTQAMQPGAALVLSAGVAVAFARSAGATRGLVRASQRTLAPLAGVTVVLAAVGLVWQPMSERRATAALPDADARRPNVLLLTLDTLRADHVSAYGYARQTTPHLDRLAHDGLLFEHAIANSSWTLPSHASLLTGLLPDEHAADWLTPMRRDVPTLPEVLAREGYRTGAFAANTSYVAPEWGLGRGFQRFSVYGASWADDAVRTAYGHRLALNVLPRLGFFDIPGRKRAATVNEEFASWLDAASGERPFFALLNYFDPHDPYIAPAPYHTRYSPDAAHGDVINFQFQPHAFRRKPALTPEDIQAEIDAYDGSVHYADAMLGALVDTLERRGLRDNTIVLVTSDHGEAFGNHDLFGHGNSLYLETLHVPLVISWPGRIQPARVTEPVSLHRIATTLAEVAGIQTPGLGGTSLAPYWSDAKEPRAQEAILSRVSHVAGGPAGYPTSRGDLTSILTPTRHLIAASDGSVAMYAWRGDPQERVDLAGDPAHHADVEDLRRRAAGDRGRREP